MYSADEPAIERHHSTKRGAIVPEDDIEAMVVSGGTSEGVSIKAEEGVPTIDDATIVKVEAQDMTRAEKESTVLAERNNATQNGKKRKASIGAVRTRRVEDLLEKAIDVVVDENEAARFDAWKVEIAMKVDIAKKEADAARRETKIARREIESSRIETKHASRAIEALRDHIETLRDHIGTLRGETEAARRETEDAKKRFNKIEQKIATLERQKHA